MRKFKKIVAPAPVNLMPWAEEELRKYADEIILYKDTPEHNDQIIERIEDADAILVYTAPYIGEEILSACHDLSYVGMTCSLYSKESANVDINYAEKHGITVTGIRDYGDNGVTEYVLFKLIQILQGFGVPMWKDKPMEITGLRIGMVGIGGSGFLTAKALQALGAEISYYARSVKPEKEALGMHYKPLRQLLAESQVVITALNKNVILLHEEEFEAMGNGKIMFNTSIGPASDDEAMLRWISNPSNILCTDSRNALGNISEQLFGMDNVHCIGRYVGMTAQAYDRQSRKILDNIRAYLS